MEFLKFIYQHPLFTKDDLNLITECHKKNNYQKGDYLLKEGQIAKHYGIIESGLARSCIYDFKGNEITTGFMGVNEIAIEVASIFQQIPTLENMQCLTDCIIWEIKYDVFQELFHKIPAMREWGRTWMAYELYLSKKRATEMITLPATQRYLQLMQEKPHIIQQAPLKYIASYLGVTDTSLSRIRKEITNPAL